MSSDYMPNEVARAAFAESGLTYSDVWDHIAVLRNCINKALKDYQKYGCLEMGLCVDTGGKGSQEFYLYVDGPYFSHREAISFNPDGFIGFAGWASSTNTQPFVEGFMDFLTIMESRKH